MKYSLSKNIQTPEDLGIAHLGSPHTAIVPPKHPINRAEYGDKLARAEGGIFTPLGYFAPIKDRRKIYA